MQDVGKPGKGAAAKTSPRAIEGAKKSGEAVRLRLAGTSYSEIATRLGYANAGGAYKATLRGIEALGPPEDAASLRDIQRQRLEALLSGAWDTARSGDTKSIDVVLRILARQARLDGLDAPAKIAQTDSKGNDLSPQQAAERLAAVAATLRSRGATDGGRLNRTNGMPRSANGDP